MTGNYQLNWPCYADTAMSNSVRIESYTTGPANYIRIYTPTSSSEVGVSQRHRGVFGTGFQLNGTANTNPIQIDDEYARVEGLVVQHTVTNNTTSRAIWSDPALSTSDVRISHNIVKGVITGGVTGGPAGIEVGTAGAGQVFRVWNNVVYNYPTTNSWCMALDAGTVYVFNNTVFNCYIGIGKTSGVTGEFRNNVSINDAVNGTFTDYHQIEFTAGVTRSRNVSSDATSTLVVDTSCATCLTGKTTYATLLQEHDLGDRGLPPEGHLPRPLDRERHESLGARQPPGDQRHRRRRAGAARHRRRRVHGDARSTARWARRPRPSRAARTNALTISGSTATFASGAAQQHRGGRCHPVRLGRQRHHRRACLHPRPHQLADATRSRTRAAPRRRRSRGDNDWSHLSAPTPRSPTGNRRPRTPASTIAVEDFDTLDRSRHRQHHHERRLLCGRDRHNAVRSTAGPPTPSHYIDIFTPYLSSQVGTTQRHSGNLGVRGLRVGRQMRRSIGVLDIRDDYVRVTGLRIENTHAEPAGGADQVIGILSRSADRRPSFRDPTESQHHQSHGFGGFECT